MCAAGREFTLQQADRRVPMRERAIAGQRRLAAPGDHRHPLAFARVAADRALDLAGGGVRQAPGQRQIGAVEVTGGERGRQGGERQKGPPPRP